MKFIKSVFLLIATGLLFSSVTYGALVPLEYKNKVYEEAIKTVVLRQTGSEERIPIVKLSDPIGALTLVFDELRDDNDYYQYKFVHCSANWEPSNISTYDYIDGSNYDNINDFDFSQNTYYNYTNYRLTFPSKDMVPKISGNYLLVVYRDFEEDDIVLSQRFMVLDDIFKIDASVQRSSSVEFRYKKQEIDFNVEFEDYNIPNPMIDVTAVLLQNTNWTMSINELKPRFMNRGVLNYDYNKENNFWAGNEFRYFDIRSLRTMSPGVRRKYFNGDNMPVAELYKEKTRMTDPYLEYTDYNGKIVLENKDGGSRNSDISSDYVKVQFYYTNPSGELAQPVYIFGELSNWEMQDEFKMVYNNASNYYYCEAILKQGYYSYWFVTPDQENPEQPELKYTEGNHYQTENDYNILIYHKNQFLRYDELLGYERISSSDLR